MNVKTRIIMYPAWITTLAVIVGAISILTNIHAALTYPCWFDEAVLSDIAYNFQREGVWRADIYPVDIGAWIYGPIYFYLQKPLIELFGFCAATMRLGNAVATYLVAILVALMVLQFTKRKTVTLLVFILFILDSSINRAAVVGRMDMVATLFALSSYYFAYRYSRSSFREIGLASGFAALGFLTTPRVGFLLPGAVVLLLIYMASHLKYQDNQKILFLHYGLAIVIFVVPIFLWIHSIGGIEQYISAFRNSSQVGRHQGSTLFRKPEDYIFLPLLLGLFLFCCKRAIREPLLIGIFATFVSFTLFVKEVGPYRPMILPYLYIAGAVMAVMIFDSGQLRYRRWLVYGAIAVVFLVSAPFFLYRTIDVWLINSASRNARPLQVSLLNKIPADKFVAAGYEYYYLLKPQAKRFIEFESLPKLPSSRSELPDYIVLTGESNIAVLKTAGKWADLLKTDYKVIGTYIFKVNDLGLHKIFFSRRNYDGTTVYAKQP